MSVRCGNRDAHTETTHHASVEAVRACHRDRTWACTWLVSVNVGDIETGDYLVERECGGLSWELPASRGYACEHGHSHIYNEVRDREGWDYVADEDEAGLLAGRGVHPVAMDGGPINVNPAAYAYAASL